MFNQRVIGLPSAHSNENDVVNLTNRTAAATVLGGVGFIDSAQSDADSTDIGTGLDNVVAVTTARIAKQPVLVVSADVGTADNDRGNFFAGDGLRCRVLVEGTTDIAKGDKLKPVNAQVYLVKATIGASIDPTATSGSFDYYYAEALEDFTTNGTGIIECLLWSTGNRG